jgi:hypothetical protein
MFGAIAAFCFVAALMLFTITLRGELSKESHTGMTSPAADRDSKHLVQPANEGRPKRDSSSKVDAQSTASGTNSNAEPGGRHNAA